MKNIGFLFLVLSAMVLSSCSVTKTQFVPMHRIVAVEKTADSVELLVFKPRRAALCIGLVETNGNGFASHDDGVGEARKKAALLGADFIMVEKSGTETTTHLHPGYTSYQSNGSSYLNGNNRSIYGAAAQNTSAYSVGPSISTVNCPWGVFSAWVYRPSCPGIGTDENYFVTEFHLKSTADAAGMKIGDKVIGIDDFDIKDESLAQHLMEIFPGDCMVYTVLRDGKRIDFNVTAIVNH